MLTCIARSKQAGDDSLTHPDGNANATIPKNNQAVKSLTSQLRDMALKASGAYRHCAPCSTPQQNRFQPNPAESEADADLERFRWPLKRTMSSSSSTTPRTWGKEMEARLKGISSSSGEGTPPSSVNGSGRRVEPPIVLVEESEPKEWVAQVEPGVLITFVSLPRGGNDLRRIRFSRDMFNKWQAQKWWAENYDKVMELYNVQRLSRQAFPLPTPPRSEDEENTCQSSKMESAEDSPVTPPLTRERLPRNLYHPTGMGMSYSSSDSLDHHHPMQTQQYSDSGELSISNASDMENEWVEQDEPGVYITIRALPGGKRELRRVRFRYDFLT
ncbi:Protein Brevis radix-like 4 [Linum perenne]